MLLVGASFTAHALSRPLMSTAFHAHQITCDRPVRLSQDCSAWRGATRRISIGKLRLTLAGDESGRTILITRVRPQPKHNGIVFSGRATPMILQRRLHEALGIIRSAVEDQGICLERLQPILRGQRLDGLYAEFSDNVYDFLKGFTILESGHLTVGQQAAK